ncbi:hypothetical protein [Pistricoccus aurantiacus]|uniref:hypothetical protein n=1 Tax=Pistricoccus aurantiacus TaxID=1883414 RepID=UPI00363963E0
MTDLFETQELESTPPKDLSPAEQIAKLREEAANRLYQHDPVIREKMDAERMVAQSKGTPQAESKFLYDEQGNLLGVKPEFKHKVSAYEQMKAIRENTMRKYNQQANNVFEEE